MKHRALPEPAQRLRPLGTPLFALLGMATIALLTLGLPPGAQAQRAHSSPKVTYHSESPTPQSPLSDLNALVLAQIEQMPKGGTYATTSEASARLRQAISTDGGQLRVTPQVATPSYCSGATYLVFLKTLGALQQRGQLQLSPAAAEALAVKSQPDGTGLWGRWNANGPGTARLFHELGLGRNFESFEHARPGDFLKIFWTSEVGSHERGHSVVYLGREMREGVEHIRFWSSNTPAGYGAKSVPRTKIAYALFSRLENPARVNGAESLPAKDLYLASLLSKRSSAAEVRTKSGVQ